DAVHVLSSLTIFLGSRIQRLLRNAFTKHNVTAMLVLILYFLVISFLLSMAVMVGANGMHAYYYCLSTFWICAILYSLAKLTVYTFFVERVRVVRAAFVPRSRDWMYISCMVIMLVAFGAVFVYDALNPMINMNDQDGRCHLGITGRASITSMAVDMAVNSGLTGCFIYLLQPIVKIQGLTLREGFLEMIGKRDMLQLPAHHGEVTVVQRRISGLMWKSLIGSISIHIPMVALMIQFYVTEGRELALVCCTLCVIDVSWDAVVVHWLTFGSIEAEKDLTQRRREEFADDANYIKVLVLEEPPIVHSPNTLRRFSDFGVRKSSITEMVMPSKLDTD
ncbi:hypothetical protein P280DRAFT_527346, partial [Massarina eburnea CBS 473.64]